MRTGDRVANEPGERRLEIRVTGDVERQQRLRDTAEMKRGKANDGMKRVDGGGESGESAETEGDAGNKKEKGVMQLIEKGDIAAIKKLHNSGEWADLERAVDSLNKNRMIQLNRVKQLIQTGNIASLKELRDSGDWTDLEIEKEFDSIDRESTSMVAELQVRGPSFLFAAALARIWLAHAYIISRFATIL